MQKKIPMRQCMGCRERLNKKEMIRVVRRTDGEVQLDFSGKLNGRGAYICPKQECLKKARKAGSLARALEVPIPVEVYDPEWYTASVELEEYLIYLEKGASFDPEDYLKAFLLRGDEINVRHGVPVGVDCGITGKVDTNVPGVYSVKYVLSKDVGLTTFSGQAVLIVIVQE